MISPFEHTSAIVAMVVRRDDLRNMLAQPCLIYDLRAGDRDARRIIENGRVELETLESEINRLADLDVARFNRMAT
jgi:hypothetical protein